MEEIVKILVVAARKADRLAAAEQLKAHDLTVIRTCEEAQSLFTHRDEVTLFDLVLVDLRLVRSSGDKPQPCGYIPCWLATKNGTRLVALFANQSSMELPSSSEYPGGAKLFLFEEGESCCYYDPKDLIHPIPTEIALDQARVRARNWLEILEYILSH